MPLAPDERSELRDSARGVLERRPAPDRELWQQMVELGWTGIHVPDRYGGAGAGWADLGIVLHELGRAVTTSPFLASAVLATGALLVADNDALAAEHVTALVGGDRLGSVALAGAGGAYETARLTTGWERAGSSIRLAGEAGFVLDAGTADLLVVAARSTAGEVALVAVDARSPGIGVEATPTVDATRRLGSVTFDGVEAAEAQLLCDPGPRAEELFSHLVAIGAIAAAGDATGATEHVLERAAAYAQERVQFDKPIGSFQAVKHHCANMAIAVEASRAATEAAFVALDGDRAGWSTTAAVTASYVGPACSDACGLGLRIHGGLGFTWEHESHRYLKRVKLDEVLFGTPSWHRRRLAHAVFPTLVGT